MYIISSDGRNIGDYVEVSRRYNNILGWTQINGKFTILGEFPTDSIAQASFEDYVRAFRQAENKKDFVYQIIGVDKYNPIAYN